MRVAVLDSLAADGTDRLGHGSAVAATIRRSAPDVEIVPVQIFRDRLLCGVDELARAIEWCGESGIELANLSIGTANPLHGEALARAVQRASGVAIVAAHGWLPGNLDGVIAVDMDARLAGPEFRVREVAGRRVMVCSGESGTGLYGVSFAVANATGLLAGGVVEVGLWCFATHELICGISRITSAPSRRVTDDAGQRTSESKQADHE
jgi:subtilisin family serine protease